MKIQSAIAAGVFAIGTVAAGVGIAAAAPAPMLTEFIGNYASYEACAADGNSPRTGGTQWECIQVADGWDLHTY
ncbi:hypothetical protein [Nocardia australiensis]|uniref:hypothetical protein n=1 Tax=Nocardia australiensis TaxID=2887191 RepID=UPI001D14C864|nr:hypothetical protein [Nocardia australiensis]